MKDSDDVLVIQRTGSIIGVNAYTAIPEAIFKNNFLLEKLLDDAPVKIAYRKENDSTFFLNNEALRLCYDSSNRDFSLIYLNLCPSFFFKGVATGEMSQPYHCKSISLGGGSFEFPDLYFGTKGLVTWSININRPGQDCDISEIPGKKEWFDRGSALLQKAAMKYNLSDWYDRHHGITSTEGNVSITSNGGLSIIDEN